MYVRLRALKNKKTQTKLAKKYFNFLKKRTKQKTFKLRKKMKFNLKV